MNKSKLINIELLQMVPDQLSARTYLESRRWPDGVNCPACGEAERIGPRKGGFYRCNACLLDFTVRTGTILERSRVPLQKWLYAIYLLVTAPKRISSVKLHEQIGVTQKTAWFMLQRLDQCFPTTTSEAHDIYESMRSTLDAATDRLLARRPADKGQQARKIARRVKRQSQQEPSI